MKKYKWINEYTGELRANLWDLSKFLTWYFFHCIRRRLNPIYPGKWKYNRKGW